MSFSCLPAHFSPFLCCSCHNASSLFCLGFLCSCKSYRWCWLREEYRNVCGDPLMSFLASSFCAYFVPDLSCRMKSSTSPWRGAGVTFARGCNPEGSSDVPPARTRSLTFHSSTYVVCGLVFWLAGLFLAKKPFFCELLLCLLPHMWWKCSIMCKCQRLRPGHLLPASPNTATFSTLLSHSSGYCSFCVPEPKYHRCPSQDEMSWNF